MYPSQDQMDRPLHAWGMFHASQLCDAYRVTYAGPIGHSKPLASGARELGSLEGMDCPDKK